MVLESFRPSGSPSLGVELELQLVDARSMALRRGRSTRSWRGSPPRLATSVKPEFYDCCVEINTGVCRDVAEVGRDLAAKLGPPPQAAAAARASSSPGAGRTRSPTGATSRSSPTPRYRELAELYRETLCRQLTFGLHVHVGVGDGDAAVRACNRIAEHLPALLALSANSPFWCGRATGLHSHRVEVMGASPTGGLPPRLRGWDDYVRLVDRLTAAGLIKTPKELWWDVRPSPEHGTVEVRMCDMPPDLPSVLGLTALIQCLVHALARDSRHPRRTPASSWPSGRTAGGRLDTGSMPTRFDPLTGRSIPARQRIEALVEELSPVAAELGCSDELARVRRMANQPTGAERQLAVYEGTRNLQEVSRSQVASAARETSPFHLPYADVAAPVNGVLAAPRFVCLMNPRVGGYMGRPAGAAGLHLRWRLSHSGTRSMCRIAAYFGGPARLSSILTGPSHGLKDPSRDARRMTDGPPRDGAAAGLAPVLVLELAVDRRRRPRPLGGGDDDELDVAVRVARQEQAGHAGALLVAGADLVVPLASRTRAWPAAASAGPGRC